MAIERNEPQDLTDGKFIPDSFSSENVVDVLDTTYRLELKEFEDWTTYTEADPNGRITVAEKTITLTNYSRQDGASYVYKDMGANYFDGDFEHKVKVNISSINNEGLLVPWMVTNTLNTINNINDRLNINFYRTGTTTYQIAMQERISGTVYFDSYSNFSTSTDYYLKIVRDESVGTYGTLYCYIYSNEAMTTLVDTLTLTLHSKADWRYIFNVNNWMDGTASTQLSGTVEDFRMGYKDGSRTSPPLSLNAITKAGDTNIEWTSTEPANTDIKVYTAVNSDDTTEPAFPADYTEATSGSPIATISADEDLTGKYLWVRQELTTTNTSATPRLSTLLVSVGDITRRRAGAMIKFL